MAEPRSTPSSGQHRPPGTARRTLALVVTSLLLIAPALAAGAAFAAQETPATDAAPTPDLTLERIVVEPAQPGPDTLCKLTVTIRNHGAKTASQFGLKVSINGDSLSVYGSQLFLSSIAPGATLDLPLYNFWTTESGRTPPAKGRLELEITLVEAEWMEIADHDGVEVWTPLGAVERLPPPFKITVPLD